MKLDMKMPSDHFVKNVDTRVMVVNMGNWFYYISRRHCHRRNFKTSAGKPPYFSSQTTVVSSR